MTYHKLYNKAKSEAIKANKEESAVLLLLIELANMSYSELYLHFEDSVDNNFIYKFNQLLHKYLYENIPVQHLIGYVYFMGYKFNVNSNVLIPRSETEQLVEETLYLVDDYFKEYKNISIADVATGSACIAVSLKKEVQNSLVYATDISSAALEVAKKNALENEAEIKFLLGDMLEPLIKENIKVDLLISNPPYIPDNENVDSLVKDNEPNVALFGGNDGLDFYKIILSKAKMILKDKFIMAFEHAYNKKEEIYNLVNLYFSKVKIIQLKDFNNKDRMTFVIGGFNDEKR